MEGQQWAPGAEIPPPMSEQEFIDRWKAEHNAPSFMVSRDVTKRSTVDVTGATEALVVGPTDVLIINFPAHWTMRELYQVRDRLLDSDLRPGQILLIAGADKMVKVTHEAANVAEDLSRPYVRPQATIEGAGTGEAWRCTVCKSPIERGLRCGKCGRGWLVEEDV